MESQLAGLSHFIELFQEKYAYQNQEYSYRCWSDPSLEKDFGIGIYEAIQPVDNMEIANYYLLFLDDLYSIAGGVHREKADSSPLSFLLSDINGDGFFEFSASFNTDFYERNVRSQNYLRTFDSKSGTILSANTYYGNYICFEASEEGFELVDIYTKAHLGKLRKNNKRFRADPLHLKSDSYEVDVTVEKGNADFPLLYPDSQCYFLVKTKLLYLGEAFSYNSPDSDIMSAKPVLIQGENRYGTSYMSLQVVTPDELHYGDIREGGGLFSYELPVGYYDFETSFNGEMVSSENFLHIYLDEE